MTYHLRFWFAVLLWGLCLSGCAAPGAAVVQPGAVAPHLGESNSAPLVDVKAQVEAMLVKFTADLSLAVNNHIDARLSSVTNTAASQPAAQTDSGNAGRDKTWYQVPIQAIGDGGIIMVIALAYLACKAIRDIYRISRGAVRTVRDAGRRRTAAKLANGEREYRS